MKTEPTVAQILREQIKDEENNYYRALYMKKPIKDVKAIQDRIDFLKSTLESIENRYTTSADQLA